MDSLERDDAQTLIVDHAQRPSHFGALEPPHFMGFQSNPFCGDRFRIYLRIAEGQIQAIQFVGNGCAISMASASMMTNLMHELSIDEAASRSDDFLQILNNRHEVMDSRWGDLRALAGVRAYPLRVRCASLPWLALLESLDNHQIESHANQSAG